MHHTRQSEPFRGRDKRPGRVNYNKQRTAIHVNFIWRSLSDVMYTRLAVDEYHCNGLSTKVNTTHVMCRAAVAAGASSCRTLLVTGGLNGDEEVPCTHLIATRGAATAMRRPCFVGGRELPSADFRVESCAAYSRKGCCQRGYGCPFAHPIVLGDEHGDPVQGRFRASRHHNKEAAMANTVSPSEADTTAAPPKAAPGSGMWWFHDPYTGSRVRCVPCTKTSSTPAMD